MKFAEWAPGKLIKTLAGSGIVLDIGAASIRVRSDSSDLADALRIVYGEFPVLDHERFCEVSASIQRVGGARRFFHPQVDFEVDGQKPFEPFPADTHLPLLEWGVNWTLAERFNHCLLLHSGVVEKHGVAIVLPAIPGSGKSTLTAARKLYVGEGYQLTKQEPHHSFGKDLVGETWELKL